MRTTRVRSERRLQFALPALAATILLASCGEEQSTPPQPRNPAPHGLRTEKLDPPLPFTDVSASTGVELVHFTGGFVKADGGDSRFLPECMGPGVILFDVDGDGDLDLFAANGSTFSEDPKRDERGDPRSRLYRCDAPFRYTDVTDEWEVEVRGHATGGTAADYDGDGDVDLLVTGWDSLRLLRNEGSRLVDVTLEAGLRTAGWTDRNDVRGPDWSTSAAFFDCDKDGDLDLFVCMYARWCPGNDVYETLNGQDKSFAAPAPYEGNTCRLFRNNGEGGFDDITEKSGVAILDEDGYPKAKALGVALWELNGDDLLDIIVANDGAPNFLFLSCGPGKFVESGIIASFAYDEDGRTRAGMGIDAADVYNDGRVGISIGNFSGEPVSLYLQNDRRFMESSQTKNISAFTQTILTFGLKWGDMDLDGLPDIVLSNGHLEPEIQQFKAAIPYRQTLRLLKNRGDFFTDWTPACGAGFQEPLAGRGLALADLDGDGDIDILVGDNGGKVRFMRNDQATGRHWLRVRLVGKPPNVHGLGSWVILTSGSDTQRRLVTTGGSYASQGELVQTFGLGMRTNVARLVVKWPDGKEQVVKIDGVDKEIVVKHDG